jgi:hypothetical protein
MRTAHFIGRLAVVNLTYLGRPAPDRWEWAPRPDFAARPQLSPSPRFCYLAILKLKLLAATPAPRGSA